MGEGRETPPAGRQLAPHLMCEAAVCKPFPIKVCWGQGEPGSERSLEKDSEVCVPATVSLWEHGRHQSRAFRASSHYMFVHPWGKGQNIERRRREVGGGKEAIRRRETEQGGGREGYRFPV